MERLSKTIGRIYDAALMPELWQSAVKEIVAGVSADSGQLFTPFVRSEEGGFHISEGIGDTLIRQYTEKYHAHDVWTQALEAKGLCVSGNVVLGEELVPHAELTKSIYYREFLTPANAARLCASVIFGPDAADLHVTFLSTYRRESRPFGHAEKQWLQLLSPHVSRALGMSYRLQDASFRVATTQAALDRIHTAVVLIDSTGAVSFLNRTALELMENTKAIGLHRRLDGRDELLCARPATNAALSDAIRGCLRTDDRVAENFSTAFRVPRGEGEIPLLLNLSPLPAGNSFGTGGVCPAAIVFVSDPVQPPKIDGRLVRDLFQLTPTEIEVFRLACRGHNAAEIARERRVDVETARSQLKRVYVKTGTASHAALVRLAYGLSDKG